MLLGGLSKPLALNSSTKMEEGRECAYDTVSGTQEAKSVVILQKNSEI
jgi:hypothetical protein